jgi:hypothetical protein
VRADQKLTAFVELESATPLAANWLDKRCNFSQKKPAADSGGELRLRKNEVNNMATKSTKKSGSKKSQKSHRELRDLKPRKNVKAGDLKSTPAVMLYRYSP